MSPNSSPSKKKRALEKLAKTVTVRADSLATTEEDFLKTLFARLEETQEGLNENDAQKRPAPHTEKRASRHEV